MKDNKLKVALIISLLSLSLLFLAIKPEGYFEASNPPMLESSIQALLNPELKNFQEGWSLSDCSSASNYPTSAQTKSLESNVTMEISGSDVSFYAVALTQGSGPTAFNWGPRTTYIPINSSTHNIVTWRGSIDDAYVPYPHSCVGIGVDFWFDAKLENGTLAPVEMYVFFHQDGLYALPLKTYKNIIRADWNFSSRKVGMPWNYMYFHLDQLPLNVNSEVRFELYDFIQVFKQRLGEPFTNAEFFLARVDACMELFFSSGMFTVDYLGLEQAKK